MKRLINKKQKPYVYFCLSGMKLMSNEQLARMGWTKGGKGWGSEEAKRYQREVLHFTGKDIDGKIGLLSLAANSRLLNSNLLLYKPVSRTIQKPEEDYSTYAPAPKLNSADKKLVDKAKSYGYPAYSVAQIRDMLTQLLLKGLYDGKVDGIWGPKTQAGYELMMKQILSDREQQNFNSSIRDANIKLFLVNVATNPVQGGIDGALYLADVAGAPSNATNFLRDLNVSLPYRAKAAAISGIKTIFNDNSFLDNYQTELANPSKLVKRGQIVPLINSNINFNDEQMLVIKDMALDKSRITNKDIKRVSEDGRYGNAEQKITEYFSPTKIVLTALGQTSGKNNVLSDYFDVNTVTNEAEKDNEKYLAKLKNNEISKASYGALRAIMPYISSLDIMPDEHKVRTFINLN